MVEKEHFTAAEVERLIEKTRGRVMSPKEREVQMVSYVYGNQPDDRHPKHTKAEIRKNLSLLPGPPDE